MRVCVIIMTSELTEEGITAKVGAAAACKAACYFTSASDGRPCLRKRLNLRLGLVQHCETIMPHHQSRKCTTRLQGLACTGSASSFLASGHSSTRLPCLLPLPELPLGVVAGLPHRPDRRSGRQGHHSSSAEGPWPGGRALLEPHLHTSTSADRNTRAAAECLQCHCHRCEGARGP